MQLATLEKPDPLTDYATPYHPDRRDGRPVVALSRIRPHRRNDDLFRKPDPRGWESRIKALADSMRRHGLRDPVTITRAGHLVAGHRRLAAAKSLGWKSIWVRYREYEDEAELDHEHIVDNLSRQPVDFRVRCAVYRERARWIYDADIEPVKARLIATARDLEISPRTVRADVRRIREQRGAELTPARIRQAWENGRKGVIVNIHQIRGTDHWLITVTLANQRNVTLHEAGPGPWEKAAFLSYERACSSYYKGDRADPRMILAGLELVRVRKEMKLTQARARAITGLSQSYWSELEHGLYSPEAVGVALERLREYEESNRHLQSR